MTNVFERARAIRMNGEPWQNAVQRAGSQLRYENQAGGAKRGAKKGVSHTYPSVRKSPTTDLCHFHKPKSSCRLSAKGKSSPRHAEYLRKYGKNGSNVSPAQRSQRDRFRTFAKEDTGVRSLQDHIAHRHANSNYGRKNSHKKAARGSPKKRTSKAAQQELNRLNRIDMSGGKGKRRSSKSRASPRTGLCHLANTGLCHRTKAARKQGKRSPVGRQGAAQARFREAAAKTKGISSLAKRNEIIRDELNGTGQAGGDGFSDTSSTRSSDFTSVSSNDSSSLW